VCVPQQDPAPTPSRGELKSSQRIDCDPVGFDDPAGIANDHLRVAGIEQSAGSADQTLQAGSIDLPIEY
jgi:hypothetical protein